MKRLSLLVTVLVCLGAAFTVQSATKPTGTLKVATPGVLLELKIDGKAVPVPNGREVPLPADTYKPAQITCGAQAPGKGKPQVWTIKSSGPFGKLATIDVTEGKLSSVEAGAPLVLKASVGKANAAGGKVVTVGLSILGKAGESYNPATVMKGLTKVPPPEVQIRDEKGGVLSQGKFEYG
ncbi:MAG TPA: hypothetical protein VM431_10200 [Phycisphaerae bacterium]|nr:hypothetical protein [Phycisphaerae bacterium]